jgi:hypothetical protein
VKVVDLGPYLLSESLTLMKKKIAPSQLEKGVFNLFDKINLSHYLECYLSSSKLDCLFFIKLQDENGPETMNKIVALGDKIKQMWGPPPDNYD